MKLHRRQVRNEVFALAIMKSGGSRREILQNSLSKPEIRLYSETFVVSASFFPAGSFQNLISQSAR